MTTVGPISISTGNDDGLRSSASFDRTANPNLTGNIAGTVYNTWLTFRGMTITQGATVDSATLTMTRDAGDATGMTVSWKVRAVAADDPAPPTTGGEYDAFTWTTATVTGSAADPSTYSIDVASVIQEVVNRAGFAGDKIILQFADNGTAATAFVRPASYESSATEAQLTVTYTAGSASNHNNLLLLGCG